MRARVRHWLSRTGREPLVHFLLAGMVIYALSGLLGGDTDPNSDNTIRVTEAQIGWLEETWRRRWGRSPTPVEHAGLIGSYIRETVLYREALAMGLDEDDTIIRRRLAQKLEFLAQDLVALTPPGDADLRAYLAEHRQRYRDPVRFTFTQIFVDPDKRGDATLDDARAIKASLMAEVDDIDNAAALGDGFMLQSYYPENSRADIQKLFGGGFAESLADLAPGRWHGPVLSGYGVHLVYVHGRTEPPEPVFSEVRERVKRDWQEQQRDRLNEAYYESLLGRYWVIIEDRTGSEGAPAGDGRE